MSVDNRTNGGNRENARLVYSTETGRVREPAPAKPQREAGDRIVWISRTSAGRKGKTVTLVAGLPPADLAPVAKELRWLCGSGGSVKEGVVELQGDHRERVAEHLKGRYRFKLAGG